MARNISVVVLCACALGALAENKSTTQPTTDSFKTEEAHVQIELVRIPAGKITLKDENGKDRTHAIKSIWIGKYEIGCWARSRRKFFDAKETGGARAAQMLEFARRLYAVEDEAKAKVAELVKHKPDAPADERHAVVRALRQEAAVPVLTEVTAWLDREKDVVLRRSPMAQAIGYTLNQWDALCRYVEQGWLNIDNNAAERALKRVAIGRKNWLFAGNDAAGMSHARLWTLIASAERHGLDPQAYLRSVLAKIGNTPMSGLGQFLPDVWKAEDAIGADDRLTRPAPFSPAEPPP